MRRHRRQDRTESPRRHPIWRASARFKLWMVGLAALAWLIVRSGSKPSRLAYPCQQTAFGMAAAVIGIPAATAVVSMRGWLRERLAHVPRKLLGPVALIIGAGLLSATHLARPRSVAILTPPTDHRPEVYLVNDVRGVLPGRFGGVDDLVTLMGAYGLKWHRSTTISQSSGPDGMIDPYDVVLIKVNSQWPERGGTNTDVLRGIIRAVVEHPDGFTGEVIVADSGQGRGSFVRGNNNAEDTTQSTQDVVDDFYNEGYDVSTQLWDTIRGLSVDEYDAGDMRDGYVVSAVRDPETDILVSYPKFHSAGGNYISYRHGVWLDGLQAYSPNRLVVINVPVLKTHSIYAVTASVKNHMGVVTMYPSFGTDSHNGVGRGGLGSLLAEVRLPDLNILDCIWVLAEPGNGPWAAYANASRRDQLVAGTDPLALDAWATKNILIPQIIANGFTYADYGDTQDVDNPSSTFRNYLDKTMNELLLAGIATTNDYHAVSLKVWAGDFDRDGDLDLTDYQSFAACMDRPDGGGCAEGDADGDTDLDLRDFATFQILYTGS